MPLERSAAVDRLRELVATVQTGPLPVPVREVWVYGDVVLGVDPVERLEVYVTKDLLLGDDATPETDFQAEYGVEGVGKTVSAEWAEATPEALRANPNGYAAPEKCLAAHLFDDHEPIHLEVCNTGFEDNVTQRLEVARAREDYTQLLDPRAACLWVDDGERDDEGDGPRGTVSETAFEKLREGAFVLPTLEESLSMLGLADDAAADAADALAAARSDRTGVTVRGDVV